MAKIRCYFKLDKSLHKKIKENGGGPALEDLLETIFKKFDSDGEVFQTTSKILEDDWISILALIRNRIK